MSIVLDLIILAIISLYSLLAAKKGFVRGIIELAFLILAIIVVATACKPLANITYDKAFEPFIVKTISKQIDVAVKDTTESVEESIAKTVEESSDSIAAKSKTDVVQKEVSKDIKEALDQTFSSLPKFLKNSYESMGIDTDEIAENINKDDNSTAEGMIKNISQNMIKPLVSQIVSLLYSLLVFILAKFLGKIVARILNKFFTFSLVGKVNTILGAFLGIPSGVFAALIFCGIVSLVLIFMPDGFLFFTRGNIEKTYLFNFLTGFLPF